jgi:type 1 glutamine amidotransferase
MVLAMTMITANSMAEQIKVLIVDGFSNHDWKHSTQLLQQILEGSGDFAVEVSTFDGDGWKPEFQRYDVVIQNCNDIKGGEQWSRAAQDALEYYVQNGGGLYVFHSANNAFLNWPDYNRMIGLGWRDKDFGWAITLKDGGTVVKIPAGEGEDTGHGDRVNALITRIGEHPIHTGLPKTWMAADIEVYRYGRGPAENLTVLSFAHDEKTTLDFPVEWTVDYGKGRVYTSTFGHVWHDQKTPEGMLCAGHQTLIPRIVQWLGAREVSAHVPDDFPTNSAISLRSRKADAHYDGFGRACNCVTDNGEKNK